MIVARGLGRPYLGLVTTGLGRWLTVVVLPDRVFVSAVGYPVALGAETEWPAQVALVLWPFLLTLELMPRMTAREELGMIEAVVVSPTLSAVSGAPGMTAVVVLPDTDGSGS